MKITLYNWNMTWHTTNLNHPLHNTTNVIFSLETKIIYNRYNPPIIWGQKEVKLEHKEPRI